MSRSACAPFWFCWWAARRVPGDSTYYVGNAYASEQELASALLGRGDEHPGLLPLLAGCVDERGKGEFFPREHLDELIRAERERERVERASAPR